ncbi:hypothetical protein [Haliscomenobacter hydrossis]|uniref:Uncharacterized protein n=1 Tax=Haliscomenobacter hydrossis (strain ATCC 27775 / DSM 1100 / LMG 10767 / O) TaxID=760192 RepID=F4L183_HALH1|nr:hypothetical protein [Haliscomenobacter hydrossis]AEE52815.1 hypothetical protein Halhy_4987 [Haliscomenobacter hydrossis DSM 1100]
MAQNYLPLFWEDDYCQIEIVPFENKEYILKTIGQISDLANNSRTGFGFTETFGRGQMPVSTFSEEIRTDYLEKLLTGFEFEKAKSINYDSHKILDCETGLTKAYGFSNFTVFFDTEDEFVKNIWLSISSIVSVRQCDLIKLALYDLGEECEMVLIDWNSLELFDLRDKIQIDKYLNSYWK